MADLPMVPCGLLTLPTLIPIAPDPVRVYARELLDLIDGRPPHLAVSAPVRRAIANLRAALEAERG